MSRDLRRAAPRIGLALALAGFLLLNLWARHDNYFFYDELEIVLHRYGLHDLLEPTNGHPVIMWLPIYYLMRPIFGLGSALPYELVGMAAMGATACLVFGYLRARAGEWVALIGAILILFYGAGDDVLFWSFQLAFAGSVGAGVAALWALDRESARRDLGAAALLIASVFFLAVGLAFVAAAVVAVALATWSRGPRATVLRALRVAGPAVFLYIVWYLAYGHDSPSRLSADNLIAAPSFMLEGAGASLAFFAGLAGTPATEATTIWGLPLLGALAGLAVWRVAGGPPVSRKIWIGLAGAAVFWFLTAVNKPIGGDATSGRYCFVGAVFALIVIAELVRGVRWTRLLAGVAAVLVLVSVVGNLAAVRYGRDALGSEADTLRANLAALDIAEAEVEPSFVLTPDVAGSPYEVVVDAGSYFKAKDRYGTPALSEAELAGAAEPLRANADAVLRAALPVTLDPVAAAPAGLRCTTVRAGTPQGTLSVPRGQIWWTAGAEGAELAARRFADGDVPIGTLEPGETAVLRIPGDASPVPWQLTLTRGEASVCRR